MNMDEKKIEELKILERADKIVERLFKALYCEEEGDMIDYPTLMSALVKFTASVLLAVQEQGKLLDVEEDFTKAVMELKASMGKGMKMQKIQEQRDRIKLKIKENEEKLKDLERKQEELLRRFPWNKNDILNWIVIFIYS